MAIAYCDRCDKQVQYETLVRDGYNKGLWVCPTCYDPHHIGDDPIKFPKGELKPLKHARPPKQANNVAPDIVWNLWDEQWDNPGDYQDTWENT